jgi:hypothetical protein
VDSSARFVLPIGDEHFVLEATDAVAGRSGLWNSWYLLHTGRNGALLTLRLQPPTHLAGRVVTADDEPLPFATVHLEGWGGTRSVVFRTRRRRAATARAASTSSATRACTWAVGHG